MISEQISIDEELQVTHHSAKRSHTPSTSFPFWHWLVVRLCTYCHLLLGHCKCNKTSITVILVFRACFISSYIFSENIHIFGSLTQLCDQSFVSSYLQVSYPNGTCDMPVALQHKDTDMFIFTVWLGRGMYSVYPATFGTFQAQRSLGLSSSRSSVLLYRASQCIIMHGWVYLTYYTAALPAPALQYYIQSYMQNCSQLGSVNLVNIDHSCSFQGRIECE